MNCPICNCEIALREGRYEDWRFASHHILREHAGGRAHVFFCSCGSYFGYSDALNYHLRKNRINSPAALREHGLRAALERGID